MARTYTDRSEMRWNTQMIGLGEPYQTGYYTKIAKVKTKAGAIEDTSKRIQCYRRGNVKAYKSRKYESKVKEKKGNQGRCGVCRMKWSGRASYSRERNV
jgi:hypothetical protein